MKTGNKTALLFMLYLSQGLPFGFQATALPVLLREQGVSLAAIGFAGALALPWFLKPLWAPLVDRYWSARIGRRRSWIIPLQALMVFTMLASVPVAASGAMSSLLACIFLMNLCAATQDIAVDGLAVDILGQKELGPGNAAQVAGYKMGMVLGGGILVWLSARAGWSGLFLTMAVVAVLPFILILLHREVEPNESAGYYHPKSADFMKAFLAAWRVPGAGFFLLFIATYKMGESMIDPMFKPFLVDNGFTAHQIGLWVGTWGMIASLIGSVAGGWLASRLPIVQALFIAAAMRLIPLIGELWLATIAPTATQVIGVTIAEHFFGGILTTALFAYMMSRVDRQIGATHYTVLAAIEVFGKSPGSWASGYIAQNIGYTGLFSIGVTLSVLVLLLYFPLRKGIERPHQIT
jgi:MFS transporter, PAT family, beta-lactamase induction signal transducer AmpG